MSGMIHKRMEPRDISLPEKAHQIPMETKGFSYKIPTKTIEILAEDVQDSKEWYACRVEQLRIDIAD